MDATGTTPPRESESEVADSRCTCCQPASATSDKDETGKLAARRAAVVRRLRQLGGRVTHNHEEMRS